MANRKDLLRDKLNALNPSVPTNTRGEAAGATPSGGPAAGLKNRPRRKTAPKAKAPAARKPAPAKPSPEIETGPAAAPREAPGPSAADANPFAGPFLFSALMQENIAALNRMREAMATMNSLFFDSCRRCAGLCFENWTKGCVCYPRSPAGKWPLS